MCGIGGLPELGAGFGFRCDRLSLGADRVWASAAVLVGKCRKRGGHWVVCTAESGSAGFPVQAEASLGGFAVGGHERAAVFVPLLHDQPRTAESRAGNPLGAVFEKAILGAFFYALAVGYVVLRLLRSLSTFGMNIPFMKRLRRKQIYE